MVPAMGSIDVAIARLASTQFGVVSHEQLRSAGASRDQISRRCKTGHLVSAGVRGVYRISGAPISWRTELITAVLFAGRGAAASHRSAARLHGILRVPELIEICTPRRRRTHDVPSNWIVHSSIVLPRADIMSIGGIPTSTVERTLIDLGAVQPAGRVAHALDSAIRDGKTDLALVRYVHARRRGRGRRGAGVLAGVLARFDTGDDTESPYERDLLNRLIDADLPLPRLQFEVRDGSVFVARADFAWESRQLIVEVDGHGFHSSREQRASDAARQNRLTRLGWRVLRFTTDQIATDPSGVIEMIHPFL